MGFYSINFHLFSSLIFYLFYFYNILPHILIEREGEDEREGGREKEREGEKERVREREKERERERERERE